VRELDVNVMHTPGVSFASSNGYVGRAFSSTAPTIPDNLKVGDFCFVKYKSSLFNNKGWYVGRIVSTRNKPCDPIQVEFKKTLSGDTSPLLLPSPTRAWVDLWSVRRKLPTDIDAQLDMLSVPRGKRACASPKGAMNVDTLFGKSIQTSKLQHAALYTKQGKSSHPPPSTPFVSSIPSPTRTITKFSKLGKTKERRKMSDKKGPSSVDTIVLEASIVNDAPSSPSQTSADECFTPSTVNSQTFESRPQAPQLARQTTEMEAAHGLLRMVPELSTSSTPSATPMTTPMMTTMAMPLPTHLIAWYFDKPCVNSRAPCSRMPMWCSYCPTCGLAQTA